MIRLPTGATPLEVTVITSVRNIFLEVGDRIGLSWSRPNRLRSIITRKMDPAQYEVTIYRRPSRGFARHIRRLKERGQ